MDKERADELASGAPGQISLNGKMWLVSQPRPHDFVAIRRWARKRIKTPLQQALEDVQGQPRELAEIVLTATVNKSQPADTLTPEAIEEQLATPEGCALLLWLLARRNHPEVTPETFKPHLTEETVDGVLADILEATGLADLDPNALLGDGSSTASPPT